MRLVKTLRIKIGKLSKKKKQILLKEYSEFQKAVKYTDNFIEQNRIYSLKELTKHLYSSGSIKVVAELYSATYQTAYTEVLKAKKRNKRAKIKRMHLTIRHDTFELRKIERNKLFRYFAKIPVASIRGGILLPLHVKDFQEKDIEDCQIGDSRIEYSNGNFFLHLAIEKEVEDSITVDKDKVALISIDLGERNPAVSVILQGGSMKPVFYRENIRAVRAHYRNLRQSLGKKKLLKKIKQISDKERRVVRDINHKISAAIVKQARELRAKGYQPVITMGRLTGIRGAAQEKGRRIRRAINQWSYYQLQQYIKYKANWDGIPVGLVSEYKTSKLCHHCGHEGLRKGGLFRCNNCSMEYNADLNGALNIGTRSLEYIFRDRASTMFNSLANASVLREFSGVKHRSVTMPLSWTEKSGKDTPSHVYDPATARF